MPVRPHLRRLAVLGAASALLAPTGAVATPAASEAGPGSDVDHYNLRLVHTPRTDRFTGRAWIRAHATRALERFTLDSSVKVSKVRVNGQPATFRQPRGRLVVTPRSAVHAGQALTVKVVYRGAVPARAAGDGWLRTADGVVAVGRSRAPRFYPGHQDATDKATFDLRVTVPRGVEAVGNGLFLGTRRSTGGRTWHWRESAPMSPRHAFFAVGQYDLTRVRAEGRPTVVAVPSRRTRAGRAAAAAVRRTPEVIAFAARQFGRYPFEAAGGIVVDAPVAALWGRQSRPVYSQGLWRSGRSIYPVVHAVAQQWFGASLTGADAGDRWLEDGLGAYAEWQWSQAQGEGSSRALFGAAWEEYAGDRAFWAIPLDGADGSADDALARRALLERGAMTLHALRTRIGGPAFHATLRRWSADHRHAQGSTADLVAAAESESGEDLTSFFDAWLSTGERPATTRANGFPRGFAAGTTTPPASWARITQFHELLAPAPPSTRP